MLVDLLKTFPHPVHQEKLLSQIVSYLILTKNDLIRALEYIPMLLNIKNVTCVYSLLVNKKTYFSNLYYTKNIILKFFRLIEPNLVTIPKMLNC